MIYSVCGVGDPDMRDGTGDPDMRDGIGDPDISYARLNETNAWPRPPWRGSNIT